MILTPAVRAQLITLAKSRAEAVANCVAASVPFAHLVSDLPGEGLLALITVLAEGRDPYRLHQVCTAGRDEPADDLLLPAPLRLRRLHAEYRRYRKAGIAREDIPQRICRGEAEYQLDAKQRQRQRRTAA